jgi:hypothetical protein
MVKALISHGAERTEAHARRAPDDRFAHGPPPGERDAKAAISICMATVAEAADCYSVPSARHANGVIYRFAGPSRVT